jgi:hypothetical protein
MTALDTERRGDATPSQSARRDDADMDNHDDALLAATDRAREAEQDLRETPAGDQKIVPNAKRAYQRAEEVDELAKEAAELADGEDDLNAGRPG